MLARRFVLPWALQGARPVGELLEIGAGGAAMATRLLATFPDVRLVATDYDPDIVAAAQATLPPFKDRASTQRVAAAAVPFADGRFNLVLSFGMLHHVIDRERALAEAVRVLRPGGLRGP